MKRTLIHNATIVNEGQSTQGSVVIENGRIAEVLTNWKPLSAPCEEVIDATGCYLLPGIIDDHVHFRDPGLTHKADILTESSAAAAGGVTSIMDMPNTNPLTVTLDALNSKFDLLNEKCIVNHSCYFGATNDNYTEFDKLDKSRVCGIKLFMGSSTGNMLVDKMNSLLKIFNGTDMPDIRTPERSLHIRNAPESLNYPVLQDSQTYWYSWPGPRSWGRGRPARWWKAYRRRCRGPFWR